MSPGAIFLGVLILLVLFAILESRRQRKKYGRSRHPVSSTLMRAGLLEMQSFLEPEKKIEIFLQKEHDPDQEVAGDPPTPGPRTLPD